MAKRKIDYQALSPYALTNCLDELSIGVIPYNIKKHLKKINMRPFELMEDAIFYGFRSILLQNVKKLGADCLFQSEPEGIIICDHLVDPCAIIYECKSRKESYNISRTDMLSYKDYIARKQLEIRTIFHVPLTHFIIIGPSFSGHYRSKILEIEKRGITVSLIKGIDLKQLFIEVDDWQIEWLRLINLTNIFVSGIVEYDQILTELKRCKRIG